MSRRRYLVTYDIAQDRRRTRVYKSLLDFGDHIQFSVFLCQLNPRELVQLRAKLEPGIHHHEDQILVVDLGAVDNEELSEMILTIGRDFKPPERTIVV